MSDTRKPLSAQILRWSQRTPVHTFVMCPLLVIAFELALNRGRLTVMPWGVPLLAWGYLQYLLVGNYRLPRAGGTPGMDAMPAQIIASGPYRYTRNPMYLGHLIFMAGLVLTFWSWFALILLVARAMCSSGGFCTTRRDSKGRSALNIPRTGTRRCDGSHSYCDAATRRVALS